MGKLEQDLQQKKFNNEVIKANINILFTANFIYNQISSYLKPYDLTHEQFNVLRILRGKNPECMCQKDVLSRMVAPKSNLTLILKKLIAKNLVLVSQSPKDKREYEISITDLGLGKLSILDTELINQDHNVKNLTVNEAIQLNELLDKIRG
jgi:DNA-binding MarR family transcriptional regulator